MGSEPGRRPGAARSNTPLHFGHSAVYNCVWCAWPAVSFGRRLPDDFSYRVQPMTKVSRICHNVFSRRIFIFVEGEREREVVAARRRAPHASSKTPVRFLPSAEKAVRGIMFNALLMNPGNSACGEKRCDEASRLRALLPGLKIVEHALEAPGPVSCAPALVI